eukprot:765518-Hanusia_phi.AAC.11
MGQVDCTAGDCSPCTQRLRLFSALSSAPHSIVDLEKRTMEVNVCNVNLRNICFCRSESSYTPDSDNPSYTRYGIMVQTRAFPKAGQEPANSHTTSTGGQDMSDKSTPRFQAIHRWAEFDGFAAHRAGCTSTLS